MTVQSPRKPSYVRQDARGTLTEVLNEGAWGSVLTGRMNAGAILGNHYHKKTLLYFHLLSGQAVIRTCDVRTGERGELVLNADEGTYLQTMESHAICFAQASSFIMLKSQRYDPDEPDTYPFQVNAG